jgi:hypothetical protein
MRTYENANYELDCLEKALKDNVWSKTEKKAIRKIIRNINHENYDYIPFGNGRKYTTTINREKISFIICEATRGYNLGVVE